MTLPKSFLFISTCMLLLAAESDVSADPAPAPPAHLEIDLKGPVKKISPLFPGLMTEEINHSYDGGLYGELVRNRTFQEGEKEAVAWSLNVPADASASMQVTDKFALTDKVTRSLEVEITKVETTSPVTVSNEGYWGIPVRPSTSYQVSFYAAGNNTWQKRKKEDPDPILYRAPLNVSLMSADGSKVYATAATPPLTGMWQKIELTLKTDATVVASKENRLVIGAASAGTFRLSLVSLFPPTYKNRPNGNRIDLMESLAGLHPQFLRFPGGNYVEGGGLAWRFNWKEQRGPLEFRPGHHGSWGYPSSDGLGLLEFMGWCEDLGMEPVLAVFAGYSIGDQPVFPGPLLDHYVQEALEEIEYLTGDAKTSYWGALRAKDGHPEAFKLKYIEIGNEDWDHWKSYDGRFAQFYDALKAKYPDLQLIATLPVKSRKPDVVDEHFYKPTDWFVQQLHHYDNIDRSGPKILVGEWATRNKLPGPTSTLQEALGDAAWMCAMERNADLVIMQSYAPLLVNVNPGAYQWKPNLIGYDALHVFVSPSWHAQALFNTHRGDEVVASTIDPLDPVKPLPYSVSRDSKKGLVYVKLVNPSTVARPVQIDLMKQEIESNAEMVILTAKDPCMANSLEDPDAVAPVTKTINNASSDFSVTLDPSSLTILTLKLQGSE